jgi:restriction system protein
MSRRRSSLAEDLILCPWWFSVVLAAAAFVVLPSLLPAAFHSFVPIVVFVLLGLAGISALRSWNTRTMIEQQIGLDSIRALPWKRFEDLLGEAYRRQGYKVEETLGGGADGGVDLVLSRNGEVVLVQCKRWKGKPVPVQTVRELYGVLHDRAATSARLVSTSRFTPDAMAFAKGKPIELIDQDDLLELISGVQASRRIASVPSLGASVDAPPACPKCGSEMVMRTAKRGPNAGDSFWGCSGYPKCDGTRSIGS